MPMNDILMTNDTSNNRWKVSYTVDQASTKSKILNTAGTFVDRNIQVEITTPAATFTNSGSSIVVDQGGFVASGTTEEIQTLSNLPGIESRAVLRLLIASFVEIVKMISMLSP